MQMASLEVVGNASVKIVLEELLDRKEAVNDEYGVKGNLTYLGNAVNKMSDILPELLLHNVKSDIGILYNVMQESGAYCICIHAELFYKYTVSTFSG